MVCKQQNDLWDKLKDTNDKEPRWKKIDKFRYLAIIPLSASDIVSDMLWGFILVNDEESPFKELGLISLVTLILLFIYNLYTIVSLLFDNDLKNGRDRATDLPAFYQDYSYIQVISLMLLAATDMEVLCLFPWAERDENGYPSENQDRSQKVLRASKRSGRIEDAIQITLQVAYMIMKRAADDTTLFSSAFTGATAVSREFIEAQLIRLADPDKYEEYKVMLQDIADDKILTEKEKRLEEELERLEERIAVIGEQHALIEQRRRARSVMKMNDTDRKTKQEDDYREKLETYKSEQLDKERVEIKNRIKYLNQSLSKVIACEEIVEQQKMKFTNKVPQQDIEMGQISKKPVPTPSSKANQYRVIPGLVSDSSNDTSSTISQQLNKATILEELSDMKKQILSNGELMTRKEEEIKNKDSMLKSKEEIINKNQEEIQSKEIALKLKDELIVKTEEEVNCFKKMLAEEIQAKQEILKSKKNAKSKKNKS